MTMDVVSAVFDAAGRGSPIASVLAFGAGVISSIGPCAAPRYVAIVGIVGRSNPLRRCWAVLAFATGVAVGSVAIVFSSALIARMLMWSSVLYAVLGAAFLAFGAFSLIVQRGEACAHPGPRAVSTGGVFFLGSACALVPSSCCTPLLAGLGTLASTLAPLPLVAVAIGFTLGHLSALLAAVLACTPLERLLARPNVHQAVRTVSSGLLVALGCYYAVLA